MRHHTAVARATIAAARYGEPMVLRSNSDRTWWWFERASFVLKHPDVAVGVRSVIMPSGELRPIKRETTE